MITCVVPVVVMSSMSSSELIDEVIIATECDGPGYEEVMLATRCPPSRLSCIEKTKKIRLRTGLCATYNFNHKVTPLLPHRKEGD